MAKETKTPAKGVARLDRRRLLAASLLIAAPAGAASSAVVRGSDQWSGKTDAPEPAKLNRYQFFSAAEGDFVEAACSRIIPNDDLGPGAVEAGVPQFIDAQLAGPFGRAERWYMLGPWAKGEDTQGYQSRMTPAALYRAAIKAIDAKVSDAEGSGFASLEPDKQDAWLKRLEDGKADLSGADGKAFFDMFLQNVMEGFWSDPIYGGNRDMAGWKLIGYPGARYDRRDWALRHNQPYDLPPVGIAGRPDWSGKA